MQNLKPKFQEKTGERLSNVQSCIRTNDIELWGDGSHLCFFRMVGCFSFGNPGDYEKICLSWLSIVEELGIELTSVHVHPDSGHKSIFEGQGSFEIVENPECEWSDGNIGGYCSEFFVDDLEIGNLVNPMGDSVDVGFGLERMCKLLGEEYEETYDIEQFLEHCWKNGIKPGQHNRNYTVRKVLRLWLRESNPDVDHLVFKDWIDKERKRMDRAMSNGYMMLRRHWDKPYEWWWNAIGLLPEEVEILKRNKLQKEKKSL